MYFYLLFSNTTIKILSNFNEKYLQLRYEHFLRATFQAKWLHQNQFVQSKQALCYLMLLYIYIYIKKGKFLQRVDNDYNAYKLLKKIFIRKNDGVRFW